MPPVLPTLGLLLLAAPAQESQAAPAPDPEAVLDELVERTNALETFHALYRLRKGDELEVRFDLAFAGPDRMRLAIEQVAGEGTMQARSWVVGTGLFVRAVGETGAQLVGDVDFARLPDPAGAVLAVLAERFPVDSGGLGPGPELSVSWGLNPESDKAEFDLNLIYQTHHRSVLLGWFKHLHGREGEWSVDDQILEWRRTDGRIVARVSRASGFLESLRLVGADGTIGELELVELDLAPDLAPKLFEVPPRGESDEDMFPDPIRAAFGGLAGLRRGAYQQVDAELVSGGRAWDEGLREDWMLVVAALHESTLARVHDGMHGPIEERTVEMAAAVREQLAKAPEANETLLTSLREQVRAWRDGLVRSIDQEQARYLDGIAHPGRREGGSEHVTDLHALEREQVGGMFASSVREPLLALFDERLSEALGG